MVIQNMLGVHSSKRLRTTGQVFFTVSTKCYGGSVFCHCSQLHVWFSAHNIYAAPCKSSTLAFQCKMPIIHYYLSTSEPYGLVSCCIERYILLLGWRYLVIMSRCKWTVNDEVTLGGNPQLVFLSLPSHLCPFYLNFYPSIALLIGGRGCRLDLKWGICPDPRPYVQLHWWRIHWCLAPWRLDHFTHLSPCTGIQRTPADYPIALMPKFCNLEGKIRIQIGWESCITFRARSWK